MKSIINKELIDYTKTPIFFGGDGLSIQRYDKFKYPKIFEMYTYQKKRYWDPDEVDLYKDISDYAKMTDNEKFIFTGNLKYQTLLDTSQSRGIPHLLDNCTNNEVEIFCKVWEFFETIHSESYSHIINNVYPSAGEVFDTILEDEEIIKRAMSVTKYYDDLINSFGESEYEQKKTLYLTLFSINILEGIRFYVSFACSFAFAEMGKMEGNAKILKLICRDENIHLGFTQRLLSYLRNNEDEGFKEVVEECEPLVIQMYKDAASEEMAWADYLFKDGQILGLNAEILKEYMKYLTNDRMKFFNMEPIFNKTKNPLKWMDDWVSSEAIQEAPQETEKETYLVSAIKNDLSNTKFNKFIL